MRTLGAQVQRAVGDIDRQLVDRCRGGVDTDCARVARLVNHVHGSIQVKLVEGVHHSHLAHLSNLGRALGAIVFDCACHQGQHDGRQGQKDCSIHHV